MHQSESGNIRSSYYRFGAFLSLLFVTAFALSALIQAFLAQDNKLTKAEPVKEIVIEEIPDSDSFEEEEDAFIVEEPLLIDEQVEEEPTEELVFTQQVRTNAMLRVCAGLSLQDQQDCTRDILLGYFTEYYIHPISEADLEEIPEKAFLFFKVNQRGQIINPSFRKMKNPSVEKAFLQVAHKIQEEQFFIPASINGKSVEITFYLPINKAVLGEPVKVESYPEDGTIVCRDPELEVEEPFWGDKSSCFLEPPPPPPPPPAEVTEMLSPIERMPVLESCATLEGRTAQRQCTDRKVFAFIGEHIKYPKNGLPGKAIVQYKINVEGEIIDPVLLRDPGGKSGKAALKVVKKMARQMKYQPGIFRGKPIECQMILPIKFQSE